MIVGVGTGRVAVSVGTGVGVSAVTFGSLVGADVGAVTFGSVADGTGVRVWVAVLVGVALLVGILLGTSVTVGQSPIAMAVLAGPVSIWVSGDPPSIAPETIGGGVLCLFRVPTVSNTRQTDQPVKSAIRPKTDSIARNQVRFLRHNGTVTEVGTVSI